MGCRCYRPPRIGKNHHHGSPLPRRDRRDHPLALSALAILVSCRGLLPHQSDDDCTAIVHSIADVQQPPRPSCTDDGGAVGVPPFPTLAALSFVPLLVFMMVRYVSLWLTLRN